MDDLDAPIDQKRFDRRLGYSILTLLSLIILVCAGYGIYLGTAPKPTRIVAFETIGNLRVDDPVLLKGISVGTIGAIQWRPQKVLVVIHLLRPIELHRGYHIDNKDIGLMGDRGLSIDAGDPAAAVVPDNDTLSGTFYEGVSEAVGNARRLYVIVDSFTAVSAQLLKGTSGHASFIRTMNAIVSAVDSGSMKLLGITEAISNGLPRQLDSLDNLINGITRFSQAASSDAPRYLSDVEKVLAALEKSLTKLDTLSIKARTMATMVENTTARDTTNRIASLQKKITLVHDALLHLKQQLFQLKISL